MAQGDSTLTAIGGSHGRQYGGEVEVRLVRHGVCRKLSDDLIQLNTNFRWARSPLTLCEPPTGLNSSGDQFNVDSWGDGPRSEASGG